MNSESKNCQNCKTSFVIELEDFAFYDRVGVPPPTFCPECREVRRMSWRNERSLYHAKCAATGKDIISMFAPEQQFMVYDRNHWWSDAWDQLASGQEYNFEKHFFVQFEELLKRAPMPNLFNSNVVDSDYGNHNTDVKNCYLTYATYKSQDLAYTSGGVTSQSSLDCYKIFNVVESYESVLSGDLNRVFFSYDSDESINSAFLHACKNLADSLGCINLRNKSHCIFNKQYTKEECAKERQKYDFGSYRMLSEFKKKFREFIAHYPRRHGFIFKCTNTVGDNVINSKNVYMGFDLFGDIEDSKYLAHGADGVRDVYDSYGGGANLSTSYELVDVGLEASKNRFAVFTHSCQDTHYTYNCHNSRDLFGCVGLRNKRYCILNKQYSKEEYEAIVPKIIEQMKDMPYVDAKGRAYAYGEFFPTELSPFAYNETIAHEYHPKTKPEVIDAGYRWRDPDKKQYAATVNATDLPDHIKDASNDIVNQVIACEHKGECNEQCTTAFKITSSELAFYRAMNLALPRQCSNCRHYGRLAQRTPFRLWDRECQCGGASSRGGIYTNSAEHVHGQEACTNKFKTSYRNDRKEIIYCEPCYQAEVA